MYVHFYYCYYYGKHDHYGIDTINRSINFFPVASFEVTRFRWEMFPSC